MGLPSQSMSQTNTPSTPEVTSRSKLSRSFTAEQLTSTPTPKTEKNRQYSNSAMNTPASSRNPGKPVRIQPQKSQSKNQINDFQQICGWAFLENSKKTDTVPMPQYCHPLQTTEAVPQ